MTPFYSEPSAEVVQIEPVSGYGPGAIRDASGKIFIPTNEAGGTRYKEYSKDAAGDWISSLWGGSSSKPAEIVQSATSAPATVVESVTATPDKSPVRVQTQAQAETVARAIAPNLSRPQQQQAAQQILVQARQGRTIYAPKKRAASTTGWWILGIGAVVAVGSLALFASAAREDS